VLYAVTYVVLTPFAFYLATSVGDPNPQDPHVFWPSGSAHQGYTIRILHFSHKGVERTKNNACKIKFY
jgi:hypothetical protein